ncbi:MAG: hypothetical protein GVY19_04155 [Bacteroidetes bacterium]|jgi:hypothetical protein|nr:hypothetical protein [Bacteroidota bacterium]
MYKTNHLILLSLLSLSLYAQPGEKNTDRRDQFDFTGYVSGLQSVIVSESLQKELTKLYFGGVADNSSLPFDELPWIKDNQIHNRLNFFWYGNQGFNASVQIRSRFNWGDQVLYGIIGSQDIDKNRFNWLDRELKLAATDGINYLFQSEIDRLWLEYTYQNFEARIGRQRITWAQTFAFNPNDIFNTYSFFDVDYPEKPGSDALRTTYYLGMASKIEGAVKLNDKNDITAGIMLKVNTLGYDFQFLGGVVDEDDYVAGLGWAGFILNAGFRGEISYFTPVVIGHNILVGSAGFDYSFPNSLFLQFEYLYNELPVNNQSGNIFSVYQEELSASRLSIYEHTILLQASYPITPIFNASLALLTYPAEKGYYAGPSFDFSLTNNIQLSLIGQVFSLNTPDERVDTFFGFVRLKGNF